MVIDKFKITQLPEDAALKISGVAVVLNQEYNITQQADMTCDVTGRGVPYDTFKYRIGTDNNVWSIETTATINVQVNSSTPDAVMVDKIIATSIAVDGNAYSVDIMPNITFNDSVDRFSVSSVVGSGYVKINSQNAVLDQEYQLSQTDEITFITTAGLNSQNVITVIKFDVSNVNESTKGKVLNITTTGNLSGTSEDEPEENTSELTAT